MFCASVAQGGARSLSVKGSIPRHQCRLFRGRAWKKPAISNLLWKILTDRKVHGIFLATVTPLSGPKHVVMSGPNALTLVQSVGHPDCTKRGCTAIAPKLPCWRPWLRLLCLLFGVLVYPSVHHSCCAVFRGLRLVCSLSSVPARVWPYRFARLTGIR
jgi:hypothetical protein